MIDAPEAIHAGLIGISGFAICLIFALSTASLIKDNFQFFPPPGKSSWQHITFIWLFRLYLYPLVGLTLLKFEPSASVSDFLRYVLGGLLLLIGFGLAFRITFHMGWRNAFGETQGLKTDGWFSKSRNPIYVATWVGLLGWAILVGSGVVSGLLSLWALMYLVAPLVEEPWLEQQYGSAYREYKNQVPRFF